MIQTTALTYSIQHKAILEPINLTVHPGELLVVLGPNGAGKSTLLKLLTGETTACGGDLSINSLPLQTLTAVQMAMLRAVMPQHSQVSFSYTALEVIALGTLSHQKNSRSYELMEEVMDLTETREFAYRQMEELSGGEKQRVHLARVLLQIWEDKPNPRYLFLDEPTSSMDIAQQHQVLKLVQKVKHKNIGVLAIVHDLNLAAQYADKVLLLKKGRALHYGPRLEVMTSQKLTEVFDHPISVINHPLYAQDIIITSETRVQQQEKQFKYASIKTA